MNRKMLKGIYHTSRELAMWREKLEELTEQSLVSSPQGNDGGGSSGKISDRTGNAAAILADTRKVVEGLVARLELERLEVLEHIAGIDDPILRQIIEFRCIDLMRWNEVGDAVGISPDAARMIFKRAYLE